MSYDRGPIFAGHGVWIGPGRPLQSAAVTHLSHSVADTEAIAEELASKLSGGECIALYGQLGAGKTQFVRGLVRGLGGDPQSVCSPTFVLLNVYDSGRLAVYHLDAYRVRGEDDLESIGFCELLEQGGVVAVEWSDRVAGILPASAITVRIDVQTQRRRGIEIDRT